MKVLVTGAGGLLGSAVVRAARERGHDVVEGVRPPPGASGTAAEETAERRMATEATPAEGTDAPVAMARSVTRRFLDVTDRAGVAALLSELAPDVIVHCAGYTDVDGAETHREEALEVNVTGARRVARAAAEVGCLVLFPSTDYVFDGSASRPYRPDDSPNPINLYGTTKWMGEEEVRTSGAPWIIVRTSWLYGAGGGDFVDAILRAATSRESAGTPLRIVDDQRGRPTWTGSLAPALVDLVEMDWKRGREGNHDGIAGRVLHLADRGDATWYELAVETLALKGVDVELEPVTSEEWGAPAPRPAYSVLDISAGEACLGYAMPPWRASLRRYLSRKE